MQTDYIKYIENAERRMVSEPVEFREEEGQQYFEGYAFLYGAVADLGGFTEEIARGAADSVMNDDVRGLLNHDRNFVLGRTRSGTMELTSDAKGLKYRIKYNPNDPDHVRTMEKVKRGDISQSSFAWRSVEDKWETRAGKDHRTLVKFNGLVDVSPVTYPAYQDTTIAMASYQRSQTSIKQTNNGEKDLAEMRLECMRRELNNNK